MKKRAEINYKIMFDIIALVSIAVIFLLELINVIKLDFENKLVFDLIIVLLPAIITIVSISLSLAKENVYGVSLDDFVKLRKNTVYSFTHMVIIMAVSIGAYTVFSILSTQLSILLLDFFAFCYSLIFAIQEIPVLVRNKKRLNRIIKYKYANTNKNELFLEQNEAKTLSNVIRYMVLNDGIIASYNSLKEYNGNSSSTYNSNLFDYLLSLQNEYFWEAALDIEVLSANIAGEYKNVEIINAINTAYSNVKILLANDASINYEKDFSEDKSYHLTRSIFALHKICESLNLDSKEKDKLKDITSDIVLSSFSETKDDNKKMSFAVLMSVVSLKNGDVWFIRQLRDNNLYPSALFSFENCLLGLFISIFISHIINKKLISDLKRKEITTFLSEPAAGLNSDGSSWKQLVARMIEFSNPKLVTFSLIELLRIYSSIQKSQYYFISNMIVTDASRDFDKSNIIDAWLEIVMFGNVFGIDNKDVIEVVNCLDDDTKNYFIETISKKWIIDNELNINYQISFLNVFGINYDKVGVNFYNKEIVDFLIKYKKDYYKNNLIAKIDSDVEDIKSLKNNIRTAFELAIKDNEFIDRNIDLSEEKSLYFSWRLEKGDLKMLLNAYLKQLPESLMYSFRNEIEAIIDSNAINNYKLTTDQINQIIEFKPDKHSQLNGIIYNSSEEIRLINANIPMSSSKMLPTNLYFKDKCIRINAGYDEEHSNIRYLSDQEIDNIIDNEYQLINGLYRFSEYTNDITRSFLVTRDELKELLKKRIMYAFIVFKKKTIVDKNKCLWFKINKS